ncbi:hypothetical protein PTSG_05264 [Salpingoeca rosetta]|uniref:Ultraviolet-B receptor UVR8 n=1 Tax=Salpingoeca rosetta (strain ATCC 50818 / BSB-021) TaxID=946362 RepID=F2U9Y2_SALR5|nr:uncharacterized protein PTSG_05264 [Salpingoeca rosetta]EGD73557.1 hypothetical protein PTSG_05264 [Salpingoeca rosetta]|eukprot:XP_004993839.1 hypothetical protein PTSG_05264 [Salpingoeca rosetta]
MTLRWPPASSSLSPPSRRVVLGSEEQWQPRATTAAPPSSEDEVMCVGWNAVVSRSWLEQELQRGVSPVLKARRQEEAFIEEAVNDEDEDEEVQAGMLLQQAACSWSCVCALTTKAILKHRPQQETISGPDTGAGRTYENQGRLHLTVLRPGKSPHAPAAVLTHSPLPTYEQQVRLCCQSERIVVAAVEDERSSRHQQGEVGADVLFEAAIAAEQTTSTRPTVTGQAEQRSEAGMLAWIPVPFPRFRKIKQLACGKTHSMVLDTHGDVWAWGRGGFGQLGHGSIHDEPTPRPVEALQGMCMSMIAAGGWHSLVLSSSGDVYSFGWNNHHQLGRDTTDTPPAVPGLIELEESSDSTADNEQTHSLRHGEDVVSVACGSAHSYAVTSVGQVFGWGWAEHGQFGPNTKESHVIKPTVIPFLQQHTVRCILSQHSSWGGVCLLAKE